MLGAARRLRHREREVEPAADRLRRGLSPGWACRLVRVPNPTGDKAAIFATIGPARSRRRRAVGPHRRACRSTGQAWTADPFRLRVEDGRAYGRGAVDMKGFDALALALVPRFPGRGPEDADPHPALLRRGDDLPRRRSTRSRRFGRDLPTPRAVIVGEPTELEVVDAHKSVATFFTTRARPRGAFGEARARRQRRHGRGRARRASSTASPTRWSRAATRAAASIRPTRPCMSARSAAARRATSWPRAAGFHWEFRGLPDLDPHEIPDRFDALRRRGRAAAAEPARRRSGRIETELEVFVPGLAPEPGSAAEQLALRLAGAQRDRDRALRAPRPATSRRAGIPTIVCGPGSIDQAHQPDEYITLDALRRRGGVHRRLIADGG